MDLEKILNSIPEMIYKSYADKQTGLRDHMGGSQIGHNCDRYLWFTFRHAYTQTFPGRILRLFLRGQNEEITIVNDLKNIGCTIWETDDNGNQFRWEHGKYISGSVDAVGILPMYGNKPHLLEFKTASDKKFKEMVKKGLELANPIYYTQCQVYMYKMELERCVFIMINKNDDSIYCERIKIDKAFATKQLERADRITTLKTPPNGISDNPISWWECRFCNFQKVCSKMSYPVKNCKTCIHSTPTKQGWTCDKSTFGELCDEHLYIPPLISDQYELRDDGCIWHYLDGKVIVNAKATDFPKLENLNIHEVI